MNFENRTQHQINNDKIDICTSSAGRRSCLWRRTGFQGTAIACFEDEPIQIIPVRNRRCSGILIFVAYQAREFCCASCSRSSIIFIPFQFQFSGFMQVLKSRWVQRPSLQLFHSLQGSIIAIHLTPMVLHVSFQIRIQFFFFCCFQRDSCDLFL